MIRTILSSFLFLYPIHKSLHYYDYTMMYMSICALPISVANHAHSLHPCQFRRRLFQWVDVTYMLMFITYAAYPCFTSPRCLVDIVSQFYLMAVLYFHILGGLNTSIEQYTPIQKWVHVVFHYRCIIGLTNIREKCYWVNSKNPSFPSILYETA